MYIRWVRRGHKNRELADLIFHDAYLVESYRNEAGQPRQRNIAYLGNVREIGKALPGIEREIFLLRAKSVLETVPKLSTDDRTKLMQKLHHHVPPLSANEMVIGFHNTISWYLNAWSQRGQRPSDEEIHQIVESALRNQ